MRRQFLHAFLSSSLAIASVLLPAPAFADGPTYTFSPVNQHDINLTAAYWNPIIGYVYEKSGVRLNLKIGRTSADTTSYVLAKEVDFVFSNHLFSPQRDQLGWKVIGRRQTPPVQGQIVVAADSPLTDISQLKGQEVAFAGPEAFIVYKVPYAYLLSKHIEIKPVFAGNQTAALAQLFSGKVLAAGGNSQLVESYERRENKKVKVLWQSEPFLDLALMASSKVPEKDVKAVASAFTEMSKDPKGREILHQVSKEIGLASNAYFVPATNADYAAYRRFFQTAPTFLH